MAKLPPGTLMQRAATGLATACIDLLGGAYGARVVVLAGSGDNGGDALYAGALLARRGARVEAVLLNPEKAHAGGLADLRAAGGEVVDRVRNADLALDGIVGIGGRPGLRPNALEALDAVEELGLPVVAVDVASGVDVDTGETPERHVKATLTVTFGTHKIAHFVDPAAESAGSVELVDIGLDPYLSEPALEVLQPSDVKALLPTPGHEAHKYSRGVVGVLAGSKQYTGAAVLAVHGALGGPTGMVRYLGPDEPAALVRQHFPEVVGDGRVQAWAIGSGLGEDGERGDEVRNALHSGLPAIVDADGLRYLPDRCDSPVLLTPHAGELARMLGVEREDVEARRLWHAREAAKRWNATVLLKGSATVIAGPDGRVRVNTASTSWLSTAGSGDVLAGLCGSLLASGLSPLDAGSVGAYLHGTAGQLAADGGPMTAQSVAHALPDAIRRILG
jgi:hydroxyethylthiazole kinase-like uncharacterized protein yjeF